MLGLTICTAGTEAEVGVTVKARVLIPTTLKPLLYPISVAVTVGGELPGLLNINSVSPLLAPAFGASVSVSHAPWGDAVSTLNEQLNERVRRLKSVNEYEKVCGLPDERVWFETSKELRVAPAPPYGTTVIVIVFSPMSVPSDLNACTVTGIVRSLALILATLNGNEVTLPSICT